MEINADFLRDRYVQMETETLIELYQRGGLTEVANDVLNEILHERGVASGIQPSPNPIICHCSPKLVEEGRKLGLIMSKARLREELTNWRNRRAEAVTALFLAACGYVAVGAVGIVVITSIDSQVTQVAVSLIVLASGLAAAQRLFRIAAAASSNERVRHIKAVLKVGGYPAVELAAAEAAAADAESNTRNGRSIGDRCKRPLEHRRRPEPKETFDDVKSAAFLQSYAWRKLRMEALKLHGARCQCCGASKADGVVIHVDHIKPRKHFPELALDIDNLQVLCEACNHGKGNWDTTSWKDKK